MKVNICNLGVIKEAEIEVKPLTVFIGHNNTGKSWTAYTLAAIFGEFGHQKYLEEYLAGNTQQKYPPLEQAFQELIDQGFAQFNLIEFAQDYLELYFNDVAKFAPQWMNSYFATTRGDFNDLLIQTELNNQKNIVCEKIKHCELSFRFGFGKDNPDGIAKIVKESGEENIFLYTISKEKFKNISIPPKIIRDFLFISIFDFLKEMIFSNIYIFPTERATYITMDWFRAIPKDINKILESEITEKNNSIPEPFNNLVKILIKSSKVNISERMNRSQEFPLIREYINLAQDLEEMLRGKLDFEANEFTKDLLFQTSDNIKLEMPIVSSMVKELAPLVLYLRYLAEPNDLIIIDEPEMNLHPATQVEIIEFLAMLVNAGLNVLITTHSPYIVDHLANLMKAAKHEDPESIKERFYLEKTEAFISQDNVSVYLFEDGTAKNVLDENGYIDWGTFGNVSDDVSHVFP